MSLCFLFCSLLGSFSFLLLPMLCLNMLSPLVHKQEEKQLQQDAGHLFSRLFEAVEITVNCSWTVEHSIPPGFLDMVHKFLWKPRSVLCFPLTKKEIDIMQGLNRTICFICVLAVHLQMHQLWLIGELILVYPCKEQWKGQITAVCCQQVDVPHKFYEKA